MVDRVVTGAHYCLRDWLVQRITAALMALYSVALVGWGAMQPRLDYDTWTALFSGLPMRSFTLLFLLGVFYHAWIGVRDIVMDYVRPAGLRLAIHVGVILVLMLYGIWAVQILWGM